DIGAGLTQPGRAGTGTGIGAMSAGTSGGGTGTNRPAGGGGFGSPSGGVGGASGGVGGAGGGVGTPQPPIQSQPGSVGDTVGSGSEPVLSDGESLFNWVFGDALADLRRMEQELASITVPDAGLVYLRQMQSLIDQIDRMMEEMRAEAERQGQTIDPATQWTLDRLRQTLEEQLTQTREVLNARGLFHSGILLELENQLREGMMSEEARILAERLNRIQSQLLDG